MSETVKLIPLERVCECGHDEHDHADDYYCTVSVCRCAGYVNYKEVVLEGIERTLEMHLDAALDRISELEQQLQTAQNTAFNEGIEAAANEIYTVEETIDWHQKDWWKLVSAMKRQGGNSDGK